MVFWCWGKVIKVFAHFDGSMLFIVQVAYLLLQVVLFVVQLCLGVSNQCSLIKNLIKGFQISIKVCFVIYIFWLTYSFALDLQPTSLYCQNPNCATIIRTQFPELTFIVTTAYPPPNTIAGKVWGYWVGNWEMIEKGNKLQSFNLSFKNIL